MFISFVQRITTTDSSNQTSEIIDFFDSEVIPRIGESICLADDKVYEVVDVIYNKMIESFHVSSFNSVTIEIRSKDSASNSIVSIPSTPDTIEK